MNMHLSDFFLRFSIEALCLFSGKIYASYVEVIFLWAPRCQVPMGLSKHICFQITLRIPQEVYLGNETPALFPVGHKNCTE